MANIYQQQGLYDQTLEIYKSVLDTKVRVVGHNHISVADTKENIGLVYEDTGKKSEAKTMFTEAAKIRRHMLGPDHPLTKKSERLAARVSAK